VCDAAFDRPAPPQPAGPPPGQVEAWAAADAAEAAGVAAAVRRNLLAGAAYPKVKGKGKGMGQGQAKHGRGGGGF
jgi:hypothetical protein